MGSSGRGCDWGRCTVVVSEGVCGSGGRFGECTEVLGTHALVLGMYGATTRPLPWGAWEVCPSLILSPAGGVRDQEPDIPATLLSFTRPSSQAAMRVWISLCPLVGPFRRPYLSSQTLEPSPGWPSPLIRLSELCPGSLCHSELYTHTPAPHCGGLGYLGLPISTFGPPLPAAPL
jgi:hypothetical protein